jgi:hypothetical protein
MPKRLRGEPGYAAPLGFDNEWVMVGALGNSVKTMSKLMVPLIFLATADNHETHPDAMEFYRARFSRWDAWVSMVADVIDGRTIPASGTTNLIFSERGGVKVPHYRASEQERILAEARVDGEIAMFWHAMCKGRS